MVMGGEPHYSSWPCLLTTATECQGWGPLESESGTREQLAFTIARQVGTCMVVSRLVAQLGLAPAAKLLFPRGCAGKHTVALLTSQFHQLPMRHQPAARLSDLPDSQGGVLASPFDRR